MLFRLPESSSPELDLLSQTASPALAETAAAGETADHSFGDGCRLRRIVRQVIIAIQDVARRIILKNVDGA